MAAELDRGGGGLEVRMVRLEEALNGLRERIGTLQWAGGLFLALIFVLVGALLARSFTLNDQITALTATVGQTNERVAALEGRTSGVETRLGGVETTLEDIQGELTRLRTAVERLAAPER